jgi:hypothetical protein
MPPAFGKEKKFESQFPRKMRELAFSLREICPWSQNPNVKAGLRHGVTEFRFQKGGTGSPLTEGNNTQQK